MNVGLPGTGIGGVFYFFSIILMLFIELFHFFQKKRDQRRWNIAKRLFSMLTGVVIAMIFVDWLISLIMSGITTPSSSLSGSHILTLKPILYSILTLALVLLFTFLLHYFIQPNENEKSNDELALENN